MDTPVPPKRAFLILAKEFSRKLGNAAIKIGSADVQLSLSSYIHPTIYLYETKTVRDTFLTMVVTSPSIEMEIHMADHHHPGMMSFMIRSILPECEVRKILEDAGVKNTVCDGEPPVIGYAEEGSIAVCSFFAHYTDLVKRTFPGVKK